MDQELKQRLIGASVIIALAVIFIPMLFDGEVEKVGDKKIDISIPEAGSNQLTIKTFSLDEKNDDRENSDEVEMPESQAEVVDNRLVDRKMAPANGLIETTSDKPKNTEQNDTENAAKEEAVEVIAEPEEKVPEKSEEGVDKDKTPPAVKADKLTEATESETTESPSKTELDKVYRVKLGSFSKAENAQQVKNKLAQEGIETLVEFAAESKLYRVWSQSLYQEKQAADNYVAAVNRLTLNLGTPKVISVSKEDVKSANASGQLGWIIQLGSFSAKKNALELRNKVKLAGYAGFVDQVNNSQGETRFRVRIGPFNQQQKAQEKQQQIKDKLGLKGLVKSHELASLVE